MRIDRRPPPDTSPQASRSESLNQYRPYDRRLHTSADMSFAYRLPADPDNDPPNDPPGQNFLDLRLELVKRHFTCQLIKQLWLPQPGQLLPDRRPLFCWIIC